MPANLIIILILLASIFGGYKAGTVHALGRLVGGIAGFLAAKYFASFLIGPLAIFISPVWALFIASIIIFAIVNSLAGFAFGLADAVLKIVTRLPLIRQFDGFIGGILTLIESILVIGGVHWIMLNLAPTPITFLDGIQVIKIIDRIFAFVFAFLV